MGQFIELAPKSFLQGLFEESSTQKQRLGTLRELSDGRQFIYGRAAGANIAVGKLCQGTITDIANHGNIAMANANANETTVTLTLGNLLATANMYAEGYLNVCDAVGEGYSYKIKSHPAANANGTLVVTLYDKVLLTTSSAYATLQRHPAANIVIHPSPPTGPAVGVTVIPVTANYYAWFQKKGPTPVLIDGTVVAGQMVFPSTGVDGAVQPSSGNAIDMIKLPIVGKVMSVDANTMHGLVDLNI